MVNSLVFVYDANRDNGAMVIHAPTILHDDDKVEMNRYSSEGELFKAETWNSGFCSELTPTANDIIIPGKAYNMVGPDLMRVLEEKKIKKLLFADFCWRYQCMILSLASVLSWTTQISSL